MAEQRASQVEIGYLEKSEFWKLESRFFPSKVGGKPAWLDLKNIPVDVSCRRCGKPSVFLCQVYAPVDENEECFHRTLFIFICPDPQCCENNDSTNLRVLRCQLRKENNFYQPEEPIYTPDWCSDITADKFQQLCVVCGVSGPHRCSKCKIATYCSRDHQVAHWKFGHKANCGADNNLITTTILFPEFEILIEDENSEDLVEEVSEENKMKEYETLLSQGKAGTLQDVPDNVLEEMAFSKNDKHFQNYKKILELNSDQVLRYGRGSEPLWITKPCDDLKVPPCESCGSERIFEFQILSTLLSYLNVDNLDKSIDWGTLVIYTCKKHCTGGLSYKPEFLIKQDVTS